MLCTEMLYYFLYQSVLHNPHHSALIIIVEWDSMGSWRTDGRRSAANASTTTTLTPGSVEYPKRLLGVDSGMFLSPLGVRTPPVIRQSNSGSECDEFQPELVPEGLKIPPRNMGLKPFSREESRIQDHFGDHGSSILSLSNHNIKSQRLSDSAADNFSTDDFDSESVVSFQTQNIKPKSGKKNFGGKRDLNADPMGTTTSTVSTTGQRHFVVKKARILRDNAKQKGDNERQKSAVRKGRNVNLKKLKIGVEAERAAAATAALSMTANDMGKQEAKKLKKEGREVPSNVLKEELSMEVGNIPQQSVKTSVPLVVSLAPQRNKAPTIGPPSGLLLAMEALPPPIIPVDDLDMDSADETSVHSKMTSDNDDDDISSSFEGSSLERDSPYLNDAPHDVHTAPSAMSSMAQPLKIVARTSYSASGASSPTSSPLFKGGNVLGGRSVGGSPINGRKTFYPGSPGHFPKSNGVTSSGRKRSESKQSGLGGLLAADECSVRWAKVGSRPHSHSISPLRSHSSKRKERDLSADFAAAIMSSMTDVMNGMPSDSESSFPSPSNSGHINSFGVSNPRNSIPPHNSKLNNSSSSTTEIKQQAVVYRRAAGPSDAKNLSRNPKEMKSTGMGTGVPTGTVVDPALPSEGILIVMCSQSKSMLTPSTGPSSSAHSNKQRNSREKDRDREKEMKVKRGSTDFFVTGNPPGLSLDSLRINGTVAGIGVTRMSISVGEDKEKDKNDKYRTFRDKEKEEKEKEDKEGKLPVYDSDPNDDDCSVTSISQSNMFVNPPAPERRLNRLRKEEGEDDLLLQAPMVLEEHGAAVTCLRK
jgi:hypothetical protein